MLMRFLNRTMKETDDDESGGNRNELMTTMMRMKRMMRMMRMLRMQRMRMKMKMRMMIDDNYDEQGFCGVAKSIGSSKRKPPNAVIVSRQVL